MSSGHLSLPAVNLATFAVESFVYGIFLILTMMSIGLFFHNTAQRSGRRVDPSVLKNPMFIGTIWILIAITGHWICTMIRGFDAFIEFKNGQAPLLYYADLAQHTQVAKTAFLCLALIAGDLMMIYRLWISWGYNIYIIIFPSLCLAAAVACSVGVCYEFARFELTMNVFDSALGRWIRSNAVLTLATNVFCTGMIAWPIYQANKMSSTVASSNLLSMLAIVAESAAIYTVWTIFFLVTYETKSNLQFTTVDLWAYSAGLAFMLINVRAGLGWTRNANSTAGKGQSHVLSGPPHFNETQEIPSETFDLRSFSQKERPSADAYGGVYVAHHPQFRHSGVASEEMTQTSSSHV